MANLANQSISSTYDGLIKTSSDNQVPASGVQLLEDGTGNSLALSVGRANNGVTVTGTVNATAFVGDGSGLTGISVSPTLDEVTTNGSTTTNSITIGGLSLTGALLDSNGQAGTSGQVLSSTVTGTDWIDMGGGTDYTVQEISTNTTAVKDNLYVLTASLTLTLPASPATGDKVAVSNMSGTTTPVVARNGNLIVGLAEDLTIDVKNISVEFIYSGATEGWVIFTDSILGYASVSTVDGSGTTNYISKWSATDTLTDSVIYDDGTNVGIGTSSPAGNLHIATTGNATLILEGDTDNVGDSDTQVDATIRMMTDGGTNWWDIEAVNRSQNAGNLNFNFTGGGSAKIGLFTDLPTMELDVVGRVRASQGIYFGSDTAAANALDDYEEGTYTPTLTPTSGTITLRTGYTSLAYTKIGRIVHIQGQIGIGGVSSPSGQITFSLPYAKGSGIHLSRVASGSISWFDDNGGGWQGMYPMVGAGTITFPTSSLQTFDFLTISLTYYTDL